MFSERKFRKGVGIILVDNRKFVFVGRKAGVNKKMVSWFLKKPWQMPQGGIEQNEVPLEAAKRELLEEIGVDKVEVLGETEDWVQYTVPHDLRRKDAVFAGQKQKWFLFKFVGEDSDINLHYSDHNEFDMWRWMNVGNVIRLAVNFKRKSYIEAFKYFKWYFR